MFFGLRGHDQLEALAHLVGFRFELGRKLPQRGLLKPGQIFGWYKNFLKPIPKGNIVPGIFESFFMPPIWARA